MTETVESLDPPENRPPEMKANILVVDDRRPNLLTLEALLAPLGENLILASSGREALRHILQTDIAVILMDVQMPGMDGLETASLIRERETSRYIPIIFITAVSTDPQYIYQGYSVGAVDYITKPLDPLMLVSKVSVFVELYKKEKQLQEQTRLLHESELEALRMKQRERERENEQENIRAVNRMLEERVQERTAELEAFCYSVSHDLRTPLRSINAVCSSLERDAREPLEDGTLTALKRIRQTASKMDELILALLQLSRITRAELHRGPVDMTTMAKSIVDELRAGERDRRVEVTIQEGLAATGDPVLMRSLLFNLIENAWKFTAEREDAKIEIGQFHDEGNRTVYYVKDNGAGFNPKYANKLFKPFERLHAEAGYSGNGIGLATVIRIVRKHGGNVWAEGKEDAGAQFFFTI